MFTNRYKIEARVVKTDSTETPEAPPAEPKFWEDPDKIRGLAQDAAKLVAIGYSGKKVLDVAGTIAITVVKAKLK